MARLLGISLALLLAGCGNTDTLTVPETEKETNASEDFHSSANGDYRITRTGTVINNTSSPVTVCLYDAEIVHFQPLRDKYRAKPNRYTKLQFKCDPTKDSERTYLQIDLRHIDSCPDPFQAIPDFLGGKRFSVMCPCVPGEWETVGTTGQTYSEWSECATEHLLPPQHLMRRGDCYQLQFFIETLTQSNGCEERTVVLDGYESRTCACPY